MQNNPTIIEKTYQAPINHVWKALSDSEEMKQWYFNIPGFRPEVGFKFQFMGGPTEERQYRHLCEIKEVVQGKKLSHSWRYEGYDGDTLVTFELFDEGSSTRLKLTHEGLETFPADQPDFAKENFVVGWTWLIGTALKEYLEKQISN